MTMPDDMRAYNRGVIEEFRANAGVLGGPFSGGGMLLLTTTGRRSGAPHTAPMMFKEVTETPRDLPERGASIPPFARNLLVIASNAGAARHPSWYLNLVANPEVIVERGAERFEATARTAQGAERAALWADLVASHPFFVDHQAQAGARQIPLVVIERRA